MVQLDFLEFFPDDALNVFKVYILVSEEKNALVEGEWADQPSEDIFSEHSAFSDGF